MSGLLPNEKVGTKEDPLVIAISQLREYQRSRKILFVEDELDVQRLFSRLAEEFNCEVTYATTGQEGIALALKERFDLIVLDVILPGGPDGIDVFRTIREHLGDHPPVTFFTGRLDPEQGRRVDSIGFASFIPKPMNPSRRFFASFMHNFRIEEKRDP